MRKTNAKFPLGYDDREISCSDAKCKNGIHEIVTGYGILQVTCPIEYNKWGAAWAKYFKGRFDPRTGKIYD